ncbi:hypothetical protein [Streptomyces sp. 1222.5]|uniref:hypothetical protein n=1 Tax=Streptomyces sp. 1222.5 TaxID=1881026 RepID=UPI003D71B7DD
MEERTPAEQALSRSYVIVDGLRFDVVELSVEHHANRCVTLTYQLTVGRQGHPDERWVVSLSLGDKSWVDVLTSPTPPPDRLRQLVHLVHAHLDEWWDTKGYNRRSAKLGRRLPDQGPVLRPRNTEATLAKPVALRVPGRPR